MRWDPPRAWFPGQHALAKQLKLFPVGGLCLHVHDGSGSASQAGDFCLSLLFSVWKSPHLLLKLLRLEKGGERNADGLETIILEPVVADMKT